MSCDSVLVTEILRKILKSVIAEKNTVNTYSINKGLKMKKASSWSLIIGPFHFKTPLYIEQQRYNNTSLVFLYLKWTYTLLPRKVTGFECTLKRGFFPSLLCHLDNSCFLAIYLFNQIHLCQLPTSIVYCPLYCFSKEMLL